MIVLQKKNSEEISQDPVYNEQFQTNGTLCSNISNEKALSAFVVVGGGGYVTSV